MINNSTNAVEVAAHDRSIPRFLQNVERIVDHGACERTLGELIHLNRFLQRFFHVIFLHRNVFAHYTLQVMRKRSVADPVFQLSDFFV